MSVHYKDIVERTLKIDNDEDRILLAVLVDYILDMVLFGVKMVLLPFSTFPSEAIQLTPLRR